MYTTYTYNRSYACNVYHRIELFNERIFHVNYSVQGACSEEGDSTPSGEGDDGPRHDGHDEVLQQQVEIEEHIPSPPTLPCSPLSRPRAILATSERTLAFWIKKA